MRPFAAEPRRRTLLAWGALALGLLAARCDDAAEDAGVVACSETCPPGTRRASYEAVARGQGFRVVASSCEVVCESVVPCLFPNVPTATLVDGVRAFSCAPLQGFSGLPDEADADFTWAHPPDRPCENGVLDPGEEGVDCGGDCDPCASCTDGVPNGDETATDCGGPCPKCPKRSACQVDADCASEWCDTRQVGPICAGVGVPEVVWGGPGGTALVTAPVGAGALAGLLVGTEAGTVVVLEALDTGEFSQVATHALAATPTHLRWGVGAASSSRVVAATGSAGVTPIEVSGGVLSLRPPIAVGGTAERVAYTSVGVVAGAQYAAAATLAEGGIGVALLDGSAAPTALHTLGSGTAYRDVLALETAGDGSTVFLVAGAASHGVDVFSWDASVGSFRAAATAGLGAGAASLAAVDVELDAFGSLDALAGGASGPTLAAVTLARSGAPAHLLEWPVTSAPCVDLAAAGQAAGVACASTVVVLYFEGPSPTASSRLVSHDVGREVRAVAWGTAYDGGFVDALFALAGGAVYRLR
ncbi:MAG: hypothetical protein IT376_02080 [Polyangiaceae bacterium]|nr:hypothetical protein [Polyangiaceae bacterium]